MPTPFDKKAFAKKLKSINTRSINVANDIQEVIATSGAYYMETSNALYMSTLRNVIHNTHGLSVHKFDAYICDRFNVSKSKNKLGEFIFKPLDATPVENDLGDRAWHTTVKKESDVKVKGYDDLVVEIGKGLERGLKNQTPERLVAMQLLSAQLRDTDFKKQVQEGAAKMKADIKAEAEATATADTEEK